MRVIWVSVKAIGNNASGGSIYGAGLRRALSIADPDLEIIEVGGPESKGGLASRIARYLTCAVRAALNGESSMLLYHQHKSIYKELTALVQKQRPDLVIFNGAENMLYRDAVPGPHLLIAHNIESDIIAEKVHALPQPLRAILEHGFREIEKYQEFERSNAQKMDSVITISAPDQELISGWLADQPVVQVFPGFGSASNAGRFRKPQSSVGPIRLVFPATFSWEPNRHGIEWFIREIWPHSAPELELHLFGQGSERYSQPALRIEGHGFVPSVEEIWRDADIAIIPTFSGSGLNVKMCEALYNGIPIIVTPLAMSRLGFTPPYGIRTCQDIVDWREALSEPNARELASQPPPLETSLLFSDEAAADKIRHIIEQVTTPQNSSSS